MNEFLIVAGIFFILQLLNVILNTAKSLIMARTDNPHMSALINAVTFGFYTVVVKQIASLDITMTTIVVIITNVIGVYVTYWLANRVKKDTLWKVEVFTPDWYFQTELENVLNDENISYAQTAPEFLTVYCYTQRESGILAAVLKRPSAKTAKYNITEITKKF